MPVQEVQQFVAACADFSGGAVSSSTTSHLRAVAQKSMPQHYRMPFSEVQLQRENTATEEARHLRGLWHELAQHLVDLRYLSRPDFLAYHQHKKDILEQNALLLPLVIAVNNYLGEETNWPEGTAIRPAGEAPVDLFWLRRHLGTVTERLGRYTGWEASLPAAPDDYHPGLRSCHGRSLAYRLRTLANPQFDFADEPWFTPLHLPLLNRFFVEGLAVNVGSATEIGALPTAWWTTLADIDLLLRLYLDNAPRRNKNALLYQLPKTGQEDFQVPLEELPDAAFRTPRINPRFYDRSRARKLLRNARRRQNRLDDGLDVRLLQVKLWQTSYYVGAIDGEWGAVSHRALKAFLAEETEALPGPLSSRDKRRVRSLLLPANFQQGVYAADLKGIITLFRQRSNAPESAMAPDLTTSPDALNDLRRTAGITDEELDAKVLREEHVRDLYPDTVAKPERRVAYTRPPLLQRIWQGAKRIFRWLADKAKSLIEDILGPVFGFVKMLLRKVRMAVQRFFEGFKYLANFVFGRPVVTEVPAAEEGARPVLFATRFSLDFDGTTYAPRSFARGGAALHSAHLLRMKDSMFYFIDGVIWLIRHLGRLTNPGGWVWLGWQMVRGLGLSR